MVKKHAYELEIKEPVFDHSAHKELWEWLSRHPDKNKTDWPGWDYNEGFYSCLEECFACEYANSFGKNFMCSRCPLIWPGELLCKDYGLFYRYMNTRNKSEKTELAKQIANLPVKKGVHCK